MDNAKLAPGFGARDKSASEHVKLATECSLISTRGERQHYTGEARGKGANLNNYISFRSYLRQGRICFWLLINIKPTRNTLKRRGLRFRMSNSMHGYNSLVSKTRNDALSWICNVPLLHLQYSGYYLDNSVEQFDVYRYVLGYILTRKRFMPVFRWTAHKSAERFVLHEREYKGQREREKRRERERERGRERGHPFGTMWILYSYVLQKWRTASTRPARVEH